MFGRNRARRRRERQRVERVYADARTASETARRALRDSKPAGHGATVPDELADAIQAAILGSVVPSLTKVGSRSPRERRDKSGGSALVFLLGVGVGLGVATWARRSSADGAVHAEDEEWELEGGDPTRVVKDAINETLDRADVALRRVIGATAKAMASAVSAVGEASGPTAERVTDHLRVARKRATTEVIDALDGVEDVWGDEPDRPSPAGRKGAPIPKKVAPRKPVEGKPPSVRQTTPRRQKPTSDG